MRQILQLNIIINQHMSATTSHHTLAITDQHIIQPTSLDQQFIFHLQSMFQDQLLLFQDQLWLYQVHKQLLILTDSHLVQMDCH